MQVKRDFDRIYAEEADPWAIGSASIPRYDRYRDLLLARVHGGSLLDIGCGLGAFLARFRDDFEQLTGVETAAEAIRRGRERTRASSSSTAAQSDSPTPALISAHSMPSW